MTTTGIRYQALWRGVRQSGIFPFSDMAMTLPSETAWNPGIPTKVGRRPYFGREQTLLK